MFVVLTAVLPIRGFNSKAWQRWSVCIGLFVAVS